MASSIEAEDFDETFLSLEADSGTDPDAHRLGISSSAVSSRGTERSKQCNTRLFIRDLGSCSSNEFNSSFILAVVISKQEPKYFIGRDGAERWRLSFTVRDTPRDWVSVTCWGEESWTSRISESFVVGDAVRIRGARSFKVEEGDQKNHFFPACPHPYTLSVSDPTGCVERYIGRDLSTLGCLLRMPVSNALPSVSLEKALSMRPDARVNLLVGVKSLSTPRHVETKFGRRETAFLRVMDATTEEFIVKTWNKEEIYLFKAWECRTVAHIQDVRLVFDEFFGCIIAQTDVRTLMQHSPEFSSARALQDFMSGVTLTTPESRGSVLDLDTVDRVMVVEDVLKMMDDSSERLADGPLPFVVYGFLTSFPVDHFDEGAFLLRRCTGCKKRVRNVDQRACEDCLQRNEANRSVNGHELEFGISCEVTDHSGTLPRVWIPHLVAKEMLNGMSPLDYLRTDEDLKTQIKWDRLLVAGKMTMKIERTKNCSSMMLQLLRWIEAESTEDHLDALVNWD